MCADRFAHCVVLCGSGNCVIPVRIGGCKVGSDKRNRCCVTAESGIVVDNQNAVDVRVQNVRVVVINECQSDVVKRLFRELFGEFRNILFTLREESRSGPVGLDGRHEAPMVQVVAVSIISSGEAVVEIFRSGVDADTVCCPCGNVLRIDIQLNDKVP